MITIYQFNNLFWTFLFLKITFINIFITRNFVCSPSRIARFTNRERTFFSHPWLKPSGKESTQKDAALFTKVAPGLELKIVRVCLVSFVLVIDAYFSSSPWGTPRPLLSRVVGFRQKARFTSDSLQLSLPFSRTTTYITQTCLKVLRYLGPRGWGTQAV